MATKRKANAMAAEVEEPIDPADELMFLCLGGGNEVGRSCHIIQYKGKTVMLDAGSHAGYSGLAALPFYDDFDLSTVDVLLISHFHIDHAGSLPYVLAKTNFKGRIFMTHPTKSIYKWLLQDSIRVTGSSTNANKQPLYTEEDHLSNFPRIEAIDYHTTHTISAIRITPYPAGHVLGAAMFLIEIAGLKILFTGDYSREEDRHLIPASVPKNVKIDVLITESTYGIASHISRVEREQALMKSITGILNRGGRVLMPVFALGRAQELLLILNEYWSRHKEVQKVPIYYASNLARKCMTVYQTYIGAMNENIRRMFREGMASGDAGTDEIDGKSPWDLRYIRSLKTLERFDDMGECVMLASPGMMQNGVSRHLLERWAPSDKNGVIITGYSVEGTMARMIMSEPDQIPAIMTSNAGGRRGMPGDQGEKVMIQRRCSVQELSFAAHVSGVENREFIEEVGAPVVILVHGEQHNMMRLKSKLLSLNADKPQDAKLKVFSPRNCEELKIPFKADKTAKVVGKLASIPLNFFSNEGEREAKLLSGVLVQNDFKMSLMAPEDLREYAGLTTTTITCKQRLRLSAAGVDLVKWALEGTFGGIEVVRENMKSKVDSNGDAHMNGNGSAEEEADEEVERDTVYLVMGCVTVRYSPDGEVELEWEGNMLNDGIADAVMAVLFSVESSPAAVKQSSSKHSHSHTHDDQITLPQRNLHAHLTPTERLERLFLFLEAQFGSAALTPIATPRLPTIALPLTAPPTPKDSEDPSVDSNSIKENENSPSSPSTTKAKEEINEDMDIDSEEDEEKLQKEREAREMKRLFNLGIPVPGVEIRVDKMVAKVWLDDLEVECDAKAFGDRVRAVVERAVEVSAPLWG